MPYATKFSNACSAIALGVLWMAPLLLATAPPAHAQAAEDDASTIAAARALAIEGVKLAQSGHCEDAIDKLERAEALHHAPIVQGQLGECYVQLGKLVAGTELLRSMLREPLPPSPSLAMRKSYIRAQIVLDNAKPKIARLVITVRAAGASYVNASVDGQPVPSALLGEGRPTDPGEHVVEGAAPGFRASRTQVTLAAGQAQEVVLDLEAEPETEAALASTPALAAPETRGTAPIPALDASAAHKSARRTAKEEAEPNHTAAYVTWAAGAVALGFGAGLGIAAADAKSDLSSRCPQNTCAPGARGDLDSAQAMGTASSVFFTTAAIAGVLGTVLFFIASPGDAESAKVRASGTNLAVAF